MVSLGILGAGNWGKNHARLAVTLKEEGRLEQVVICDADPQKLKPWDGKAWTTTRVQDLLTKVDAAIVATPADSHFEVARSLLSSGVHVLVEKPMTLRAADARALAAMARDRGVVLMPGHIFRYHPAIRELAMRIRRGDLGEVLFLSTARVAWAKPRPDVGVLYSLGIHEVDLYPFLIGADYPERVQAETVFLQRPEIDVVASMFFRFAACAGFAFESWMGPGVKDRRLTVVGSKASAGVDYTNLKEMEIFPSVPGDDPDQVENDSPDIVDLDGAEPLRTEVEDFLQAAESNGRSHPIADAESGCRSVEIIESLKRTGLFIPHGGT